MVSPNSFDSTWLNATTILSTRGIFGLVAATVCRRRPRIGPPELLLDGGRALAGACCLWTVT